MLELALLSAAEMNPLSLTPTDHSAAKRLQRLAEECVDPEIRQQITDLAVQWAEMAKAKPLQVVK
jgi:hypothetical protein